MVKLVVERAERQAAFVFDQQVLVPRMGHRRAWALINDMENQVDWVGRDNPVDAQGGQVQEVLYGVHGEARPWADVDVFVVQ